MVGTLIAHDQFLNIVLSNAVEYRVLPVKAKVRPEEKIVKRTLGLTVLRGDKITSLSLEGPPVANQRPESSKPSSSRQSAAAPAVTKVSGTSLQTPSTSSSSSSSSPAPSLFSALPLPPLPPMPPVPQPGSMGFVPLPQR